MWAGCTSGNQGLWRSTQARGRSGHEQTPAALAAPAAHSRGMFLCSKQQQQQQRPCSTGIALPVTVCSQRYSHAPHGCSCASLLQLLRCPRPCRQAVRWTAQYGQPLQSPHRWARHYPQLRHTGVHHQPALQAFSLRHHARSWGMQSRHGISPAWQPSVSC